MLPQSFRATGLRNWHRPLPRPRPPGTLRDRTTLAPGAGSGESGVRFPSCLVRGRGDCKGHSSFLNTDDSSVMHAFHPEEERSRGHFGDTLGALEQVALILLQVLPPPGFLFGGGVASAR